MWLDTEDPQKSFQDKKMQYIKKMQRARNRPIIKVLKVWKIQEKKADFLLREKAAKDQKQERVIIHCFAFLKQLAQIFSVLGCRSEDSTTGDLKVEI